MWNRVYVTAGRPSVRLFYHSHAAAEGSMLCVRRAGDIQATAARPALSSKCEQCRIVSWQCCCCCVVRVSAGVGRTGTYIAVDTLMYKLHDQTTVDVYGVVYKMRLHRPYMVQTAVTICSVLFFSRLRSEGWSHHGRTFFIYLCPLSFWLTSTESPVHVLMLSTQAVRGHPRLLAPGIVPCIISFSRQLPCFLMVWP